MAFGSSERTVPWSRWTGASSASEHKRTEAYPPDNKTLLVERRWLARERDLERRAEVPEPLSGGRKDEHAINLNFLCLQEFCEHMENDCFSPLSISSACEDKDFFSGVYTCKLGKMQDTNFPNFSQIMTNWTTFWYKSFS